MSDTFNCSRADELMEFAARKPRDMKASDLRELADRFDDARTKIDSLREENTRFRARVDELEGQGSVSEEFLSGHASSLVDMTATASQDRRLLQGDEHEDAVLTEALYLNAKAVIAKAISESAAPRPENIIKAEGVEDHAKEIRDNDKHITGNETNTSGAEWAASMAENKAARLRDQGADE